jgi:hypothetical protein
MVGDMRHDQPADTPAHENFVHHPIHATVEEAAHLREVAEEGESAATFPILAGVVLAFVVPIAATLMLLAFGIRYLA